MTASGNETSRNREAQQKESNPGTARGKRKPPDIPTKP